MVLFKGALVSSNVQLQVWSYDYFVYIK